MKISQNTVDCTVVIVHYNREQNLLNTITGLDMQSALPEHVIVVNFGEKPNLKPTYKFELSLVQYEYNWEFLPVAAARNLGAEHAKTGNLVFLDVDCIPSKKFCESMVDDLQNIGGLVMGSPRYMLVRKQPSHCYEELGNLSTPHPCRPIVTELRKEDCYELFWSLCFAINSKDYKKIGGFDENYTGYGVEDTDFGLEANKIGIPFHLSPSVVYHQQHPIYIPPLNHVESIVGNCNRFHSKWGYWPMRDCLKDFSDMGFIDWNTSRNKPISIVQLPNSSTIEKHLVKNAPYR